MNQQTHKIYPVGGCFFSLSGLAGNSSIDGLFISMTNIVEHWKNLSLEDIEGEQWLPVVGYEGMYEVSNKGRVKSLERKVNKAHGLRTVKQRILIQHKNIYGYMVLHLNNGEDTTFKVHRLLCAAFLPNQENKKCVNHKNGVRHDNVLDNLVWSTHSENNSHGFQVLGRVHNKPFKGKFGANHSCSKQINQYDMNGRFIKTWDNARQVTESLSINFKNISAVCHDKRNHAGGFKWKFTN